MNNKYSNTRRYLVLTYYIVNNKQIEVEKITLLKINIEDIFNCTEFVLCHNIVVMDLLY